MTEIQKNANKIVYAKIKRKMLISLSAYATHKDYSFDEWVKIRKQMKETREINHLKSLGRIRTS